MTPIHLPPSVVLVLAGIAAAGGLSLALTYPPDRTIGEMFEVEQDLSRAIDFYSSWNAEHPTDRKTRCHTAELLIMAARPREALEVLEALLRDLPSSSRPKREGLERCEDPTDVDILEFLSEVSISLLDIERTLVWTERIASIQPDNTVVLKRLMNYYRYFNRTDLLIQTLEHHLEIENVPEEHNELTQLLLSLHRYQELIDYSRALAQKQPNAIEPHLALYQAYLDTNTDDAAIRELDTIMTLKPESSELVDELFEMRARRLRDLGQIDEAVKLYRARIAQNPKSVRLRLKLAELYGSTRSEDTAAVAELEDLVRVAPGALSGWIALGERLSWSGRERDSAVAYQKAVLLSPKSNTLRRSLAQHLLWSNQKKEALEQYRVLEARGGAQEADFAQIAELSIDLKNYQEAISIAEELIKKAPNERSYYRLLAQAALASKRCGEVFGELTEATRRFDKDGESWSLYGLCAKDLGRNAEAKDALLRANKLHRENRGSRRGDR